MVPLIKSYRFGEIIIDGRSYRKDLIIKPDGVIPNWWRGEGHQLAVEDLAELVDAPPEILVIGTGMSGLMHVPLDVLTALAARGIEVIVEGSDEAWRTYNALRLEKRIALAIHLTC